MFRFIGVDSDPLLSDFAAKLAAKGIEPDAIVEQVTDAILKALPKQGTFLLRALKKAAPAMIANHKKEHELFQRRLRSKWDKPFRLLRMLLAAAAECGEEYNETHHTSAVERDYVFDALVRLHARASLVGNEVLWLMEGGFASGALARWRTLHEISVVAFFIHEQGQQVAERYMLHEAVDTYKAANQYQEHCGRLGRPPLTAKHLRQAKSNYDKLCGRFGTAYAGEWGWAVDALRPAQPNFPNIERAVKMDHMRPYFKLACYSNHAGSKGTHFDLGKALVPPGEDLLLAGPSDAGFFDPGVNTAISVHQITALLLTHREAPLMALVIVEALKQLVAEAESAFAKAEAELERLAKDQHQNPNRRRGV